MPFPNEHSARLKSPGMEKIRVRRTHGSGEGRVQGAKVPSSIDIIWFIQKKDGKEVPVAQALRFPIKKWTESEARAWLKKNEIKFILFEPATKKKENSDMDMEGKAFRHSSRTVEGEPKWGSVDKKSLPRVAHAGHGEPGKKSTWSYPHHWIKGGGDKNDAGVFTTGTMYLHKGGLNAAWAAAQGARTGRKAPQAIINHLQVHRKALGLDEKSIGFLEAVEPDPNARRVTGVCGSEILHAKAILGEPDDPGHIQGYAAIWNNVDLGGEIMRKGAFTKSIKERVPQGKVKLMIRHWAHGAGLLDTIGTITEMKEDDKGLWYHAVLSRIEPAQQARTLVLEGHVNRDSVGYMPIKWGWLTIADYLEEQGDAEGAAKLKDADQEMKLLEHLECKILEVTLTVMPMNEEAILTAAKSVDRVASQVTEIADKLQEALSGDSLSDEQRAELLGDIFGSEAEAKVFSESIADLGGVVELKAMVDRLLYPETHVITDAKSADDRQHEIDQMKRRAGILEAEVD